jgi:hypothetical protein
METKEGHYDPAGEKKTRGEKAKRRAKQDVKKQIENPRRGRSPPPSLPFLRSLFLSNTVGFEVQAPGLPSSNQTSPASEPHNPLVLFIFF